MNVMLLVRATQRRLRLGARLAGLASGLVALAASASVAELLGQSPAAGVALGLVLAAGLTLTAWRWSEGRWTPASAASYIEARVNGLDNLVVTAVALDLGTTHASERMRSEVTRHACARVEAVDAASIVPLAQSAWLLVLSGAGAAAILWAAATTNRLPAPPADGPVVTARLRSLHAMITPPAYLGGTPSFFDNPQQITLPAGSRLRLDVEASTARVWVEEPGTGPRPLHEQGEGRFTLEWTPDRTTAVVLAAGDSNADAPESRLLQVMVVPDAEPRVRITDPGRDLGFATPTATVDIAIEASDAEALQAIRLVYIRMSGSGEAFAFDEGQVPVALERISENEWRGRARLPLQALALEDGDALVYRALVRDTNPDADWVSSDAYTVDVGKRLEFAGAGFAVPDEDRRYALSQQMVIVKTERLQASRAQLSADQWSEQTRQLATEQRMVRAEVVFLSGGEIQDEIEEAEQSHELQEGRLENAGRAEMLRAINEMSRAEALLNSGDTARALVSERAALGALQRAFDRRRYFVRTMTERSHIDPARRLTGDATGARPRTRDRAEISASTAEDLRALVRDLAPMAESGAAPPPELIAKVASVDPSSPNWPRMAAALSQASTPEARREAARAAMAGLAARGRGQAGASAPAPDVNALRGWWSEERQAGRQP
jgi:hypothetical protein